MSDMDFEMLDEDTDLMELDDFSLDGEILDDFDDGMDFEFDDEDPDEWLGTAISGLAGLGDTAWRKYQKHRQAAKTKPGYKPHWSDNKYVSSGVTGLLGGLRTFGNGIMSAEADPEEPEYEIDQIDRMEAMVEEALDPEGDATDASLAADEMISAGFGMMRTSRVLRPVMSILSRELRKIIAMARRDPRLRAAARLAPLALRRTAVALMRMVVARRRVTASLAIRMFRSNLARLMRSQRARSLALRRARMRARRHQMNRGGYRPRRPSSSRGYGHQQRRLPSRYGY